MIKNHYQKIIAVFISILGYVSAPAQGTLIDFNTIPKSGTILIYTHSDDDLIWMLPFWSISDKFIGGAMPRTPTFETIISQQQNFLNSNGYNIDYASNWITPWGNITQQEYAEYYWNNNPAFQYLANEYLLSTWWDGDEQINRSEINRIKSKLEQYIADPGVTRIITHDNWGEDLHLHHKTLNKAVRELAVKYRKDVWMLGCTISSGDFIDVDVPNGITYTLANFNKPALFTGIRSIYANNGCWTWLSDKVPSGNHKFIKIIDAGVDKSVLLTGETVTTSGPSQLEPGSYIFDGNQDYLTLVGNKYPSFTIAMRVRPDQIRSMDISKMTEYPASVINDRNFYLNSNGKVSARINDGTSKVVTSTTALTAGTWAHIVMTSNGSSLKIYINGKLENTISAGTASTTYNTPEFVLGQTGVTSSFFSGQISDVRLFNYALSDNEVATLSGFVYTITSSAGAGGNINPAAAKTVVVGANQSYTITPNSGYAVSDVKVDNISVGALTSYTFNYVTTNHTISATFVQVTFIITASAGPGGTISPSGDISINSGSNRTFTIAPNSGFKIADVKADNISVGKVSSYTFSNVTAGHTISATFAPLATYTITSSAGSGGSIIPSGTVQVYEGTSQIFNITPDIGYRVTDVKVDDISSGAISSYTFSNITGNHTISATFTATPTYTIISAANAGGIINPSGTTVVNEGSSQTYLISANAGFRITGVLVDSYPVGAVSTYTFNNVTGNHTISASFISIPTYSIISGSGAGGSIDPAGTITVYEGVNQTFTFSPNTGYQTSDIKVDNASQGVLSSYSFNNITASHTIYASFTPITYTIAGSAGAGGSISPSGIQTVNYGTNQTYNFTPNTGYRISDVKVDNNSVGAVSVYTFNNITANHTISVTFSVITYSISGSVGMGGTISPQGVVNVNYGTNKTFTITANTGYNISDVLVDNVSVGHVSSYAFNNVTDNHTISAAFTPITFTITGSAGINGSISPAGVVAMNYGTSRIFSIIPDYGYQVSDVRVDNISVGAVSSYTFNNVLANHTITASFEVAKYTINGSAGPNGSINPTGILTFNHGTDQTYTITPNSGYMIKDVRVDNVSIGAVTLYTFSNISVNHTISATFEIITYTITGSSGPNGVITPGGDIIVDYGSNQTFTITANTGYNISDVRIDNVSAGIISTYTFNNVTAGHTISATFSPITFTITANMGTGGSVSPSGIITVNYGTNQTYTFNPNAGYHVSEVMVDNNSAGAVAAYTFNNIRANHTVSATFAINTYTITGTANAGGTITPAGITNLNFGMNQIYRIAPDPGYQLSDVKVDNISVGPLSSYTFNNIAANHTISATFSIITYTITSSAGAGGSISPAGAVIVNWGTNRSFNITPSTGFRISEIKADNITVESASVYTFNNITDNHTISVTFTPITYTITNSSGGGGSVTPSGITTANYGTSQTYTITPNPGYHVSDITIDNVQIGTVSAYTFSNITADHTISTTFAINSYAITGNSNTGGSINPAGLTIMNFGTNKTFLITPDPGYTISDVRVDNISIGQVSTYTFSNITANHTISATFTIITYTIAGSASPGGSINPDGVIIVNHGTNRSYNIIPATGYEISDIKVDNISVGSASTYAFNNITTNHTISVTFGIIKYTLTGNIVKGEGDTEGGSINPSGQLRVDWGTNQTFTITPDTGYEILDITVDNISKGVLYTYTFGNVTADHTITAKFKPIIFTIRSSSGSGGSIHSDGSETVRYGTNQTYTIEPEAGYQISDVIVDGKSVGTPLSYTFGSIRADHTISATFTRIKYQLTGSAGTGGSISPAEILSLFYGANQTYTITPDSTYKISDVKVDDISIGPLSSYTFKNITASHTISAVFIPIEKYVINATAGPGGTISPSGANEFFEGSDQTFTIAPNIGYLISNIKVDDNEEGILSDFTFRNILSDHTILVTFTMDIEVKCYPNPFKDHFKINIASPKDYQFDISIIDITEKIVFTMTKIQGNEVTDIYMRNTPPGIYILRLYNKGRRITAFRIVKS